MHTHNNIVLSYFKSVLKKVELYITLLLLKGSDNAFVVDVVGPFWRDLQQELFIK